MIHKAINFPQSFTSSTTPEHFFVHLPFISINLRFRNRKLQADVYLGSLRPAWNGSYKIKLRAKGQALMALPVVLTLFIKDSAPTQI
jgi:hypothetical protein